MTFPFGATPTTDFSCDGCGVDTKLIGERYMLQHHVWNFVNEPPFPWARLLCIGCVELRLGDRLRALDFLDCPLNTRPDFRRSLRLKAAMMRS